MRQHPVSECQREFGIGPKTVSALQDHGYRTAADLKVTGRVEIAFLGETRLLVIEAWTERVHAKCQAEARTNSAKLDELALQIKQVKRDLDARLEHITAATPGPEPGNPER
jgi:hypothetical protein